MKSRLSRIDCGKFFSYWVGTHKRCAQRDSCHAAAKVGRSASCLHPIDDIVFPFNMTEFVKKSHNCTPRDIGSCIQKMYGLYTTFKQIKYFSNAVLY